MSSSENNEEVKQDEISTRNSSSHHSVSPPAGGEIAEPNGSGSERSHASPPVSNKMSRRRLVDSSSDEDAEKPAHSSTTQGEVFGGDLSSDSNDAEGDADKRDLEVSQIHEEENVGLQEDEHEEVQRAVSQPKIITSDMPHMKFTRTDRLYHARLPNFLSIETRPFVSSEYEDIYDENDHTDEEGRNRLKLKVENTLRWRRAGEATDPKYESNAKIVKWSDGTMSLMVGNETFECHDTRLLAPMHLYIRLTHGLAGQAIFDKKLKFRPSTTESKTHKKVTMNMADRTKKSGQVRFIQEVGENPDDAKKEVIRREEEALRAAYRRERDQTRRGRGPDRGRISSGFLEDRGDYSEDESPKRGRSRKEAPLIGASSDESEDDARKIEKSKQDSSDSDEDFKRTKSEKKKRIESSDEESG